MILIPHENYDRSFISDGRFAIEEFMEIMKNRQKRNLNPSLHQKTKVLQFKHCFKHALRDNKTLLW